MSCPCHRPWDIQILRQSQDYFYMHQEWRQSIVFLLILSCAGWTLAIAELWPAAYGVLIRHELLLFSVSGSLR